MPSRYLASSRNRLRSLTTSSKILGAQDALKPFKGRARRGGGAGRRLPELPLPAYSGPVATVRLQRGQRVAELLTVTGATGDHVQERFRRSPQVDPGVRPQTYVGKHILTGRKRESNVVGHGVGDGRGSFDPNPLFEQQIEADHRGGLPLMPVGSGTNTREFDRAANQTASVKPTASTSTRPGASRRSRPRS